MEQIKTEPEEYDGLEIEDFDVEMNQIDVKNEEEPSTFISYDIKNELKVRYDTLCRLHFNIPQL